MWQQSVAAAGKRRLMSLIPRNTDGCSYDRDLLKIERVCSDRSLSTVFIFSTFFPSNISCEIVTKEPQSSWNHCLIVPCPISRENGSNLSGYSFIFQKKARDSLTTKVLLKMDARDGKTEVEKNNQSPSKQWQNGTHWGEKTARFWGRHFLLFVMYSSKVEIIWRRGGQWYRRSQGVINSWPIPSRMASNLCYRVTHPSHTWVLVLYTTARTLKRKQPCAGPALAEGWQQSQPRVTAQHPGNNTIVHTQVWKHVLLKHLLERKMHITSYKEHFFSKLLSNTTWLDSLLKFINRTCYTCQWGQKKLFWLKLSLLISKQNLMLGIMHLWTMGLSACMCKCCHHIHRQGSGHRWELEPIPASYSRKAGEVTRTNI